MIKCKNCGKELMEKAKFCSSCGEKVEYDITHSLEVKDTRGICILAYFPFLWLIGLFCSDKNDPDVRFHAGQGIVLTIVGAIVGAIQMILNIIFIGNVFVEEITFLGFGTGQYQLSMLGIVLSCIVYLIGFFFQLFLFILGIIHATKRIRKPLPIVGSFAFYK